MMPAWSISALVALLFILHPASAQDAAPPDPGVGPDAPAGVTPEAPPGLGTAEEPPPAEGGDEKPALPANEEPEDADAIPKSYGIERYQASWEKNPFLLKTTPIAQPTVNWGQDWTLAGMFSYNGRIRVSIRNKQTNDIKRITNEDKPDAEFRLVRTNFSRSRKEASVVVAKGSQEAELKYDESAAPVTINNTMRAAGGAAGAAAPGGVPQPGMAPQPGMVPQPGKPVSPAQATRPMGSPGVPAGLPGAVPQPGLIPQPGMSSQQPAAATPPTISRRRQLIPAPVIPPAGNP